MAFTGPVKFQESISLEHRFSVIKLHASRSGEKSSPTSSVTNQPTELPTSTESKLGPHKHCLTKQLKNNVHGASPDDLTNYACN